MFKLILGIVLIVSSAFVGTSERTKEYHGEEKDGKIVIEEKEIYRKKFKTTGEAVGAIVLIATGVGFIIWHLSDKEKKEGDKK